MRDQHDHRRMLAEKVRNLIIEMVHYSLELPPVKYSEYISRNLCVNYTFLSKAFSQTRGITIEQYIILQKIEKVKNLLSQQELTLSEIAWKLQYSSVAHLSAQFKRVTGITATVFKKMNAKES